MGVPHSAWYFVHGNAAVREVSDADVAIEPIEIGRRFGWGSQFFVTRATAERGHNIFHFPIPAPLFMHEPNDPHTTYRAQIAQVAVQADFGAPDTITGAQAQLRWIDVWEGGKRVYTTSPEGSDGQRTSILTLTGDFSSRFAILTGPQDRPTSNVHVVSSGVDPSKVAFRGINVSVGVFTLGDRRVGCTNVGVLLTHVRG